MGGVTHDYLITVTSFLLVILSESKLESQQIKN